MLDGLVERAGVPDRHHERLVLGARPADRLAFQHLDRELDVHRHLDPGADDLAVALERVAVADVQEAALGEDREVDDDALAEAAIVHVAAVLARSCARDRLSLRRRDAEAAEHRIEGGLAERLEPRRRVVEARSSALEVELPPVLAVPRAELRDEARVDDVRGDQAAGHPARAVGPDPLEAHTEGVAPLRALDVERPGLRVAAFRDVVPVPVVAAGVDGPGADDVAARDPQDRFVRPDRRVEVSRLELVDHLASTSSRSLSPRPERFSSTSCSSSSATRANAWAGSSAGTIPSVRARRRKASTASSSEVVTYSARPESRRNACSGPEPG